MTDLNRPLPMLLIPDSSPSPTGSNTIQTGRPSLWTPSHERQLVRLYVYTTLQLGTIIDIVFRDQPVKPGPDSANKKLNTLLGKEPRWLHPRKDSDMARRCEQLDQSPTRTTLGAGTYARPHSYSAPPPPMFDFSEVKQEDQVLSPALDVPQMWPSQLSTSNLESFSSMSSDATITGSYSHSRSASADHGMIDLFNPASRRQSRMTTSSDQTIDSFRQFLPNKTDVYIQQVKRIVKRFTFRPDRRIGMSPISEVSMSGQTWIEDVDAPPSYHNRPFPLAGDFLLLDKHIQQQCFPEEHSKRWCVCYALNYLQRSVWVRPDGPTVGAAQLIARPYVTFHMDVTDDFGNTLLHMAAARAPNVVLDILQNNPCQSIIYCKNTSGQTFLHLLDFSNGLFDLDHFCQLIDYLNRSAYIDCQFLLSERDCYGRTLFHMLLAAELPQNVTQFILQRYSLRIRSTRDAFGLLPNPDRDIQMNLDSPNFQAQTYDGSLERHARLLSYVNQSLRDPTVEDFEGRNGLHCLALASLHETNLGSELVRAAASGQRGNRGQDRQDDLADSSTDRLTLRHNLVKNLLDTGVDPNHYDSQGNTPLMAFVAQLPEDGDYKLGGEIIEMLITRGARVDDRNRSGETALQIAVRCGRKLAIKSLVEQGANVHVRDAAGRSLLDVVDVKMKSSRDSGTKEVSRYEACRAHLSGKRGSARQNPSVIDEWGTRR